VGLDDHLGSGTNTALSSTSTSSSS
jgi:hypothetical protein